MTQGKTTYLRECLECSSIFEALDALPWRADGRAPYGRCAFCSRWDYAEDNLIPSPRFNPEGDNDD